MVRVDELEPVSIEFVSGLLRRLRPIDVSLALHVYKGSALQPMPALSELRLVEARVFWLAAFLSYSEGRSHVGLYLGDDMRISDCIDHFGTKFEEDSLLLREFFGLPNELAERYPDFVVNDGNFDEAQDACFVVREKAEIVYLQRLFALERVLGRRVRALLSEGPIELDQSLTATFSALFDRKELKANPWQGLACFAAVQYRFSVITGGPGTGKTTTITRLIALLLSTPVGRRPKRICLVAPTGKATDRMKGSFLSNWEGLLGALPKGLARELRSRAEESIVSYSTIHGFLKSRMRDGFVHHSGNPVDCDCLVVDESTMIDMELFNALLDGLPEDARLVLLGDKNQLAAVEVGNVFSDLTSVAHDLEGGLNVFTDQFINDFRVISGLELDCGLELLLPPLGDQVVELTKSYRFEGDAPVAQLAQLMLEEGRLPRKGESDCVIVTLDKAWGENLLRSLRVYSDLVAAGGSVDSALEELEKFRVLCGVRKGPAGVEAVNRFLSGGILSVFDGIDVPVHGLPFVVRRNDPKLGVWNGDSGVFWRAADGEVYAYLSDGTEERALRCLSSSLLPVWEAAFAITIHSSQGSEYESVAVILPEGQDSFLSWELVYTAVTRAKKGVTLFLPASLVGSILCRAVRISGFGCELLDL